MKLVMLGTNGFHPTDDGQTACYMIPEFGIVLDAGSGLHRVSNYLQRSSLDIYISHAHSDHFIGLDYLFGAILRKKLETSEMHICDENIETIIQRTNEFIKNISVHATKPTMEGIRKVPFLNRLDVKWRKLDVKEKLPGDGILTHFHLDHTIECLGFRLDWPGHSLAYVTDTIAKPEIPYVERIKEVDVLLHECYLPDCLMNIANQTGHSRTTAVAKVAAQAQVKRLFLIHHNTLGLRIDGAELDNARKIFPKTEIGLDGMEIEF